ncbi:MAG: hypothetical protein K940chlam2_00252 [Chlamydiae bacterium]|nr:hypothetical protein [Chlamydiota bacterium]
MIPHSFGTHDGTFHADEVSACALLLVFRLIDRDKIVRTRDPHRLAECEFVCDVGGLYDPSKKRFDHHQLEYQGGLASAGMIWLYLRESGLVDQKVYDYLNHAALRGIDAHDNGKIVQEEGVCTFSHIIASMVPIDYSASESERTAAFFEALDFAVGYFQRLLNRLDYIRACRKKVAAAMERRDLSLIFDEPMPWQENFFELGGVSHPALFVVMPAEKHWKLRGIPPSPANKMKVRLPLPELWAGLRGEELEKASGIPGGIFCHKGLFISVWETKEAALKALDLILVESGRK